ncbi:MAG TPA: 3,4-dihydroxy-2-butanone-4-phosphate synthase [Luteimonas sp.]|nr:3,4-dihydroxy-2-butanone-4-phosphate synthase [Luteimonas sp.]
MPFASIPELLEELRAGRMVVIVDDEDRENEGDLIMPAELVKPSDINFMVTHARGLVCLSLTRERCAQLGLPPMVRDNTSSHGTNFTVSIEAAEGVTTGISAYDRAHTIRTAVRPDAAPVHLSQPGHIFPLMAQPGGVLNRAGHTEAAADLALLAGLEPAGVLVEILNPDGSMARRPELERFAAEHGLLIGSIEDLIRFRLASEHTVERVDEREIETAHGRRRLFTYRDRINRRLHFGVLHGEPDTAVPTLVRVQLQNPLADTLGWRRPDLGPSADDMMARLAREPCAALVLLGDAPDPEAMLQRIRVPADADGTTANGLAEWRQNGVGSQILADMGLRRLRVLGTPRKQVGIGGFGLEIVEDVSLASPAVD